jgi:hypothetical protein
VTLAPRRPWTVADRRCLLALLALATLLWVPRLRGPIDLRWDAGVYYMLGTSLAEGRGYRLLNEPRPIQAIQYPPLLAAVGAAHEKLLGTSDPAVVGVWLRRSFLVLSLCYAAGVFTLSRRFLTARQAFVASLISVLHPQTIFFSDLFMAEIPFAVVTVVFLLVATANRKTLGPWAGAFLSAASGILALAAFGLRAAGLALLVAWSAESLLRRQWQALAIRTALALVTVGGWHAYTAGVKASAEYQEPDYAYQRARYQFYNVDYSDNARYLDPFRPELGLATPTHAAERLAGNLGHLPAAIGEAVSVQKSWWKGEIEHVNRWLGGPRLPFWLASVAVVTLSLPVFAGLALLAAQGHVLLPLYALASTALIALTPWSGQFSRYFVPLTPLLALALLTSYARVSARVAPGGARPWKAGKAVLAAATTIAVVQQGVTVASMFATHHETARYTDASGRDRAYSLFYFDEKWREHDELLGWLATHGPTGTVVASSTPPLVYLRTGVKSVMPPYEASPTTAQHLLDDVPVTYLVLDELDSPDVSGRYLGPVVAAYPERWRLVYGDGARGSRIYQRVGKNDLPSSGSK